MHRKNRSSGSNRNRRATTRTNAPFMIGIGARAVLATAVAILVASSASRVGAWNPAASLATETRGSIPHGSSASSSSALSPPWKSRPRYFGSTIVRQQMVVAPPSAFRLYSSPTKESQEQPSSGVPADSGVSSVETTTTTTTTKSAKDQKRDRKNSNNKPPQIICCSSTKELVHAVNSIVTEEHVVAELGSQLRDVSGAIRDRASPRSVFCDVQRDYPKAAAKQQSQLSPKEKVRINAMRLDDNNSSSGNKDNDGMDFREIEKFSDWRSAFFRDSSSSSSSSCHYDVLVLDVNAIVGNDLEWTCLDLVLEFEQMAAMVAKRCREDENENEYHGLKYVLVKSLGLNSVASQLTYTVPWLDPNQTNHNRLCRIVATVGVHDYRQTIPGVLGLLQQSHLKAANTNANAVEEARPQEDDDDSSSSSTNSNFFVLEVGCHFGTSTVLLKEVFDHVMGVDVGSKIIREAQRKYPHVFFRTGDAWKTAALLRLQQEYYQENNSDSNSDKPIPSDQRQPIGFDAVYVDVGGLSGADGLLDTIALVKSIQYALEPQCIVVKSLCLQRLASRFVPYWKWQKKGQNKLNSPTH